MATQNGGGLHNASTAADAVSLTYVDVTNNSAAHGGGLYNSGSSLKLVLTVVDSNTATDGGGLYNVAGPLAASVKLYKSTLGTGNTATQNGGGVYNLGSNASISLIFSAIEGNTAAQNGGGAYNDAGSVSGDILNNTATTGNGGGIYNTNGGVVNGWFEGNSAGGDGGAVYNDGGTVSTGSVRSNSAAQNGGGIYNNGGTVTVNKDTFDQNEAVGGAGGAIYNTGAGTVQATNSTFSDNQAASGSGGAIFNNGTSASAVALHHVTLFSNTAASGGGIYTSAGTVTIRNTIVAGNSATTVGNDCDDTAGTSIVVAGYNLFGEGSGADCHAGVNDTVLVAAPAHPNINDVLVGTLDDSVEEGGEIHYTHALVNPWTSGAYIANPAIDGVLSAAACSLNVDQRGGHRPIDGDRAGVWPPAGVANPLCDIGAYEFGAVVLENVSLDFWMTEGDTGVYNVAAPDINIAPGQTITVDVTTDGQCTVSSNVATLTPNGALATGIPIPFAITVTALDDPYAENTPHTCTITHSITVSGDSYYNNLPVSELTILIADNDPAGAVVTPTTINLTEGGPGASYNVALTASPLPGDTVIITPLFNTAQVLVSPASASLTSANWSTGVTFTVTALADGIDEGDLHASVIMNNLTTSPTGTAFDDVQVDSVTAAITDTAAALPPGGSPGTPGEQPFGPGSPLLILNATTSAQAVVVGDTLIWIFEILNPGQVDTTPVTFTASMPDVLEIITVGTTQGAARVENQLVTVDVGVIPAGATVRIAITTRIASASEETVLLGAPLAHVRARPAHHMKPLKDRQAAGERICVTGTVSGYGPSQSATACVAFFPEVLPATGGGAPLSEPSIWLWIVVGLAAAGVFGGIVAALRHRARFGA